MCVVCMGNSQITFGEASKINYNLNTHNMIFLLLNLFDPKTCYFYFLLIHGQQGHVQYRIMIYDFLGCVKVG